MASRADRLARIERFLEGFSKWLELGYSHSTAKTYISIVRDYLSYYGDIPPSDDPMVDVEIAVEFIEKYSDSLRSRRVASYAIKTMYEYLGRPDIASRIPSPRGVGWTPESLPVSYDTIRRAIEFLPGRTRLRDRAMLCVAYELALRRAEVTLLKRSQFNPSTCTVIVYRVKRPKGVPEMQGPMMLSTWCCNLLKEYLETRRDNVDALFVTRSADGVRPVSVVAVWRAFKKLAKLLGIDEARLHQLRHTRLTELAEKTKDVLALARFAGHRNPQSTMIYVHLSTVKAQERLGATHSGKPSPADTNETH